MGVEVRALCKPVKSKREKIASWIWLCAQDCLIETVLIFPLIVTKRQQPQKCMCATASTYIWPHRYHTRIVIPALCCITITAVMNEQLLKHVSNTDKEERCYLPGYLHALMAAEEWEAGERSETAG